MRIRLAAALHCSDGPYGNVTHVIVAPLARRITHLAVIEPGLWPIERLIPTSLIETGTQRAIVLRCTRAELERLIAHDELGHDRHAHAACTVGAEADLGWSLEFPEETALTVPRELVPPAQWPCTGIPASRLAMGSRGKLRSSWQRPGQAPFRTWSCVRGACGADTRPRSLSRPSLVSMRT
jgi:hypothetical protein